MTSPLQQMSDLDDKAESYWLKNVRTVAGIIYASVDVISHNGEWLQVREQDGDGAKAVTWLNMLHVVSFELVQE